MQCWRLLSLISNARQCWLLIPYLPSIIDSLNQFFCLLFLPGIVPRTNSKPGPWERSHGYRITAGASGCIPAPEPGAGTGWSQEQQPRDTEHCRISPGGANPGSQRWVESSLLLPRGKGTHQQAVRSHSMHQDQVSVLRVSYSEFTNQLLQSCLKSHPWPRQTARRMLDLPTARGNGGWLSGGISSCPEALHCAKH